MAIRSILTFPEPVLRKKAKKVTTFDDELIQLAQDMGETMYAAPGVGLAANQIGVLLQIVVVDISESEEEKKFISLINPVISEGEGYVTDEEGCLSVPGYTADVTRAEWITVKALNGEGEPIELTAEGLPAIAIQHEIDHLDGTLFIDRISRLKRELIKRKIKKALEAQEYAL